METNPRPYAAEARARYVDEPTKRPGRTSFERDRARVLHSAALRRLAAKTQVVGPGTDDFVRNRLTHSLEVAQVARELGRSLGCAPDVVETAALAHDLGHPPFGHNGERALHEAAHDCGGFEGNAQTLRILTRLESKTFAADGTAVGLNLTRASLDACVKYPWRLTDAPPPAGAHYDGGLQVVRKFGAYDDDAAIFGWLREHPPGERAYGERRCIEAQVMDLADDIAYSVHDVEDAIVRGRVRLDRAVAERTQVWHVVRDWYLPGASDAALDAALERLRAMSEWPVGVFDGGRRAMGGLKSLTSALIGRFVLRAHDATRAAYGEERLVRYSADLVVPEETRLEIAVLKGIAAHYVMRADDRVDPMREQRDLLAGLVDHLQSASPGELEPTFAEDFAAATSDAARRRVIIDQVASLTDASASDWAHRLL